MRGAECWTDHRLIRSKFNLVIPSLHCKLPRSSYNVAKLQQPQYLESFQSKLDEELAAAKPQSATSTEKWNQFREAVMGTANAVHGPNTRRHKDCFDENDSAIDELLVIKNKAYMLWQNHPESTLKKNRFKSYQTLVKKGVTENA